MAYRIEAEGTGRFPILRVEPLLGNGEKTHGHGPFSASRELIEELVALCIGRCLVAGCPAPAGRMVDTWRLRFQLLARDVPMVKAALTAFLKDGDEQPLRRFIAYPPHLRARPAPGESWDLVA